MNLFEQIHKGIELVEKGKALGKETGPVEDKVKALQGRLNKEIERLKLSEFEQRDIAVEIHSEVLGCTLWLCSSDTMVTQIKEDAPGAVCYTVGELRHLLSLNPSPESLKKIHEAKAIYPGSTVVEAFRKL